MSYTKALLHTNHGEIEIELFPDKAPLTVRNFIKLAESAFYDGTKFHRVIKDFMIQAGDPLSKQDDVSVWGTGGPGYTFEDEMNDEAFVRGALAMANAGPDTNGSQFFIVTAEETPWLLGKHTIFGRVIKGMDVAEKISKLPVASKMTNRPTEPVVLEKITLK
jgi:cyclophilin family peptidyl-prolyl cis-trans isomerase